MDVDYKFKPNCCFLTVLTVLLIYTQTCITEAHASSTRFFRSSLTVHQDTVPAGQPMRDSLKVTVDTFRLKRSADTLEAPLKYEAADSAVILIKGKKVILHGKTKTTYTDILLTAPTLEVDQRTQIVTAVRSLDSAGTTKEPAFFKTGDSEMTNDTIRYNFKTQVGLTKKTYTQQG
jgi:hypothetical protein